MTQPFEEGSHPAFALSLSALTVYPVKSCRGIPSAEVRVGPRGLEHDREWMWVDASGGFVTQRDLPRLALVETALTREHLVLRQSGRSDVRVPLCADGRVTTTVRVWGHTCPAWDEGDDVAAWGAEIGGRPLRLVRFRAEHRRPCDPAWVGSTPAEAAFADAYPMLVISEASVADLNRRIGNGITLPMDRFRPNVVVRGGPAYVEDSVRILETGGVRLRLVKPCVRCRITTTDQATAAVGVEPLRTLATYRRHADLGGVVFGQNAIVTEGVGEFLRVGMPVETPTCRTGAAGFP